jgi:hypothetical protein
LQQVSRSSHGAKARSGIGFTLLAAILVGCAPESIVDGGVTAPQATLSKSWHASDYRIIFDESSETYEVANYINGYYQLTELGNFVNDGVPGMLYGNPAADLMGGLGLSDNGLPFSIDLVGMNVSNLVFIDDQGVTVTMSEYAPALEDSPILDDFTDGVFHQRWWSTGNVYESDGVLHLEGDSASAGLWQLGFTKIQSGLTLVSAEGQSNVAISYYPWDEAIVAKCGIGVSEEGVATVFGQVYNLISDETLHYVDLLPTAVGLTHECKMSWTGNRLDFYADGALIESYTPQSMGNLEYCGEPSFYVWGNAHATADGFGALN